MEFSADHVWLCGYDGYKTASFDEAVEQFGKFLAENDYSREISWIWPEDLLLTGRRFVYVRMPLPEESTRKAMRVYEEVVPRDLGLKMAALCEMGGVTYCYLWGMPQDHRTDPQGWPGRSLMMSARTDRITARRVQSRLYWKWLSWWHRDKQGLKEFMFS